ncbi:RagB/SusD family nutrient uptake outer membrane protein [Parapedobacter sp. 10938]|uniref:RagB/SusD family nutrient uptake outer membrane protein n=1 Tax=Parapedobacter flavus TaxID=3110225 RepID=UPI002DBF6CA0|nr:RagB/SusD family nutrient uptake outer membrane protein [Parapedobacter sp. 10938]MEC3879752.1 RagB/SusD family nutrient uptake outer membrane protein [Parapedobacter sp. 10938]
MRRTYYKLLVIGLIVGCTSLTSCERYLDIKSSKSLVIPKTLDDLQALLDASPNINYMYYPSLLEVGTDDYYLDFETLSALTAFEQDNYTWQKAPLYPDREVNWTWKSPYQTVFIANTVLHELAKMADKETARGRQIKGAALFIRAFGFYTLAQVFCAPYDPYGDNDGLGIPLRLSPDFNEKSTRATVAQTYQRILDDFNESVDLLPLSTDYPTRPNKAAAYAALARIYLIMGDYSEAGAHADEALKMYNELIDFNEIDQDARIPFERFNKETIFYAYSGGLPILNPKRANVDLELYHSYHHNDLRKRAYFTDKENGTYGFKGSYTGNSGNGFFIGLAVDELFLIRAECTARAGKLGEAMADLNRLLRTRWREGEFKPVQLQDEEEALRVILGERRKELIMRGLRWSDLRRLNKDPRFAKTLARYVDDGQEVKKYTLPPNDLRYTYLIPQSVIDITGMKQNQR